MRIHMLLVLILLSLAAPSFASSANIAGCIRALEYMAIPNSDFIFKNPIAPAVAKNIIEAKTPPLMWFEDTNFQSAPENKHAVDTAVRFMRMQLTKLTLDKYLSILGKDKNQNEFILTLKNGIKLAEELEAENYPFNKVAHFMAIYNFVVDHADKFFTIADYKQYSESEISLTKANFVGVANDPNLHRIKPRLVFTTRFSDELDLILAGEAGVYYSFVSSSNNNSFDRSRNQGATVTSAHDVAHTTSRLNNIINTSSVQRDIYAKQWHLKPDQKKDFYKDADAKIKNALSSSLKAMQKLLTDALTEDNIKLRAAIIILVFEQTHELGMPLNFENPLTDYVSRNAFYRYQDKEYSSYFTDLMLTSTDFNSAASWISQWLKANKDLVK